MKLDLVRLLPAPLANRLTRHAGPLAVAAVAILVLAGVAVAALVSPGGLGLTAARLSQTEPLPDALRAGGLSEADADNDGLSDALENYLYGTNPQEWNSSGLGIPDGWLVQFGHDPLSPLVRDARGAAPPGDALPPLFQEQGWPDKYRPTLEEYYAYGLPEDYVPGQSAPWWRGGAPHADPSRWDQSGTGIPTGWLVHHGLPIAGLDADRVLPGSEGNLTVREAFEHDADPRKADSDGDGLGDWAEIHVHRTSPARFSSAGTGIGDGWLLHFGLNAFDPSVASQDPDRDGLTNLEEFFLSHKRLEARVPAEGIGILHAEGLDPLDWNTSGTGIPDGWYVRYDLDPFHTDPDAEVGRASDWEHHRAYVPEDAPEAERRAADLSMTVREAYSYGRPSDWNETTRGVWWGGTNPATLDTDEDGIPDPNEILGWYANVTLLAGPDAKPRAYLAQSNPLEGDSDRDGLVDLEEYLGRSDCGRPETPARDFPPTDPGNRDTAFSGLTDYEKVCGALRGDAKYDLLGAGRKALDPTKADSAGDWLHDGKRLDFWHARYADYRASPHYPYNGSAYRTVLEWAREYQRFAGLDDAAVVEQFRPDGDADGDGVPNVVDADPSGGLYAEKFGDPADAAKVHFLGGPQIDPSLYAGTEFASTIPHAASDPANPDTDGDGLPDAWETRYGVFDPVLSGWNLDPAKADSDGDGVNDGDANNDGDEITWYAYFQRSGGVERESSLFAFTNRLEMAAGTDPNRASTAGDGVLDGWKAFWGSRVTDDTFPNLFARRDARVGDVALANADEIEQALAQSPIAPLTGLKDKGNADKATGYVRSVNVTSCTAPAIPFEELLRPGEQLPAEACKAGVVPLEGRETNFLLIEGAHNLTYRRDMELRTNPYLADSDGDGAPDAYESYMLQRQRERTGNANAQSPHPAVADGERDADGDGLGLAEECGTSFRGQRCDKHDVKIDLGEGLVTLGAGSDPNMADTDGDGIDDGIEAEADYNPLDPSDVSSFRDTERDSDGDGVPDYLELTGWGRADFGASVRTDPQDFDTDKDGLLDGGSLALHPTTDAALVERLLARGVAHAPNPDGTLVFLGERNYTAGRGLRPDQLDSGNLGIPDGWRAYYLVDRPDEAPVKEAYETFRPSWWDETIHGVWWWGAPPPTGSGAPVQIDLDGDGLHDANGEDPMPWRQLNRVPWRSTNLTDPRDLEAFVSAGLTADDVRTRAQSIGDGAGDPKTARQQAQQRLNENGVPTRLDRAQVEILDLRVTTGAPAVGGVPRVTKGVPFTLEGRVVLSERAPDGTLLQGTEDARAGVANRSVLVGFRSPQRDLVLGAGFTNATGGFNLTANITSQQTFRIPHEGIVLLGAVDGAALATFDPSVVSAGLATAGQPNALVAWVLNTSSTVEPDHPQRLDARARLPDAGGAVAERATRATAFAVSEPLAISVFSATRFTSTLAPDAVNGGTLAGDVILQDASGGPIAGQRVFLEWTGVTPPREQSNLFTDRQGRVNLTNLALPVAVGRPDQYALGVRFDSADPNLAGSTASFPVLVRNPTRLTATLTPDATTVGESVLVTGELRTREVVLASGVALQPLGVPGATVRVALGAVEETAETDDEGRFRVRLVVPGTLAAGKQSVLVTFPGTDEHAASELASPLGVKRKALVTGLARLEGPRTLEVTLAGRLVDNEGKGFIGAVQVAGPRGRLAAGHSDPDGRFALPVPLRLLDLGTQTLTVTYAGDAGHGPAQNSTVARVTSTTTLRILDAPTEVVRGDRLPVTGRLVDDAGDPVPAVAVSLLWRGEGVATAVTDGDGVVSFSVPTNRTERPTTSTVALRFDPQPSSVLRGAFASRDVQVKAGALLSVDDADVRRGPVRVAGALADDDGRPLPLAPVEVRVAGLEPRSALTARNGSFEVHLVLPEDFPLGAIPVQATYAGTPTVAGANATAQWRVRSPLALDLSTLGPFVRGEEAPLAGRLVDDRGRPVDLPVLATLDGVPVGALRGGKLDGALDVPDNASRGLARLVLRVNGTDAHEPFERAYDVVVKVRPQVEVQLPALAVRGFAFSGDVRLLDDKGEPLRNATFAYVVGKDGSPVTGRTDAAGRATLALVAPLTGDAAVGFTVRGGDDVVSASSTYAGVRVVGPATPVGYAGVALLVLAVLALAAAIAVAVVLRRRQLTEAREILDEAIRDLLAGNEYAGTIFLAYRRFGAHLARHGFAEKASETPREFALGVRKALPVGAIPLRELIRLFEEARYSDHAIGGAERDRAVESLALVRGEIDRLLGKKAQTGVGA